MVAAAAAATLGIGVGAFSNWWSNSQNAKLARDTRKFQERMSNTAYQRAVADMELAGINPILAYKQGGSAVPNVPTAQMKSLAPEMGNSALALSRQRQELKNMKQTEVNIYRDTRLKELEFKKQEFVAIQERAKMHMGWNAKMLDDLSMPDRRRKIHYQNTSPRLRELGTMSEILGFKMPTSSFKLGR